MEMRMKFSSLDVDAAPTPAIRPTDSVSHTGKSTSSAVRKRSSKNASNHRSIALIESRSFLRDCLIRSLTPVSRGTIHAYQSVEDWCRAASDASQSLVILSMGGQDRGNELRQVETIASCVDNDAPLIVISEIEEPDHIIALIEKGARGFLPSEISLDIAVEAMNLVRAGGIFVPASSLLASRSSSAGAAASGAAELAAPSFFTARQLAVVKALRQGKANKLIAYELNMCESTVKVHVRNIMRKLKAKNRTQVAFMAGKLLGEKDS
jgi:DNA-binding NarL/FixJ family response regulator